jgi:hypothetical protein
MLSGGWWYSWDLSFVSTFFIGTNKASVAKWAEPIFESFLAGCFQVFWTDKRLYWWSKPSLALVEENGRKVLHSEIGPAFICDLEDLWYWHGVLVPQHVVEAPDRITLKEIKSETNDETKRVLVERYGPGRWLSDSGAKPIQSDDWGTLYDLAMPYRVVKLINSTVDEDGTRREYYRNVPAECATARQAIAWSYGLEEKEYAPEVMS